MMNLLEHRAKMPKIFFYFLALEQSISNICLARCTLQISCRRSLTSHRCNALPANHFGSLDNP